MLFEEFFKKKRIDLVALQAAEVSLFSEFKDHFEQMGEKSFDHTKKYWFNKLRRRFPIPLEVKTEKVHIANPLAEQTITESLIEPGTPSPKIGFTPKFRATPAPPSTPEKTEEAKPVEDVPAADGTAAKPAFKPRFNPGMVKPKTEATADNMEEKPGSTAEDAVPPTEPPVAKPGFKPRFNAGIVKPKPAENPEYVTEDESAVKNETPAANETTVSKPGFKPRFNAAMMKPKATEDATQAPATEPEVKEDTTVTPTEASIAKVGFKPRFNAAMMKPKAEEDTKPAEQEATMTSSPIAEVAPETPVTPTEAPAPKLGFKPHFNTAMVKPKTEEENKPAEQEATMTSSPIAEVAPETQVTPTEAPAPKLGFKPRFNAATMTPKPAEAIAEPATPEVKEEPAAVAQEAVKPLEDAPKPAYKPKFNMKNLPKKPDQE